MGHYPPRTQTLFDSSSANSSTYTSEALLVRDYSQAQALSVLTTNTAASRFSVEGSLDDGLNAAIDANSWSNVTTLLADGVYTLDPGLRWIRVLRSALDSQATVRFNGA